MLSKAIVVSRAFIAMLMSATMSSAFAGLSGEFGPNLVNNGGFEATSTIAGSGWTTSGFSGEGFDFFVDTAPANAHSGTHSFAGGGIGAPGFISQNLATTPGRNYNIHLWLANLSGFAEGTELQVLWGGNVVFDRTDILASGYNLINIDPLATGTTTTLSIGLRDENFFLNIDDISVFAVVPEPATFALLGLGFAGIGIARRKAANKTVK
jgi:hypothetical protein